jgi:hypothetical protein
MLTRGYFQPYQGHFWALITTKTPDFSPTDLTQWTHLLKPPQKPHLILSISLTSQACAALLGQIVPQASRAKCTMAGQSPTIYFADFPHLTPEGRGFRIWFFNLGMNKTFNPKR